MDSITLGNIVALVLLLIIIGYLVGKYYIDKKNNQENEQLKRIFENLKDVIEETMIEYLKNIDISNITNITTMQKEILKELYDKVWDMIMKEIAEMYISDETLADAIKALITRKHVEDFVDQIFAQSDKVQEVVTSKYNQAVLSAHH